MGRFHKLKNVPLDVIKEMILKHGSVKEVALKIGVSKQAIYYYIKRNNMRTDKQVTIKKRGDQDDKKNN